MDTNDLGVIVIGRNEGLRLQRCLQSVLREAKCVIYVDSGSTDGSIQIAKQLGAEVVELDLSIPFTAGRARNAGLALLQSRYPKLGFVQFIDGDCELLDGWMQKGVAFLKEPIHADIAVVSGRLHERFPNDSIYNMLCDIEWNTPVGQSQYCGGIALMRMDALKSIHGFNQNLIAGEEPELCLRLRRAGWKIFRLNADMALHDAAMTKFWQWWKRNVRAGYAYAEGAYLHGKTEERHWVKDTRSIVFWGLMLPLSALLLAFFDPLYLCLLFMYPAQLIRIIMRDQKRLSSGTVAVLYAFFIMLAKFPQLIGVLKFKVGNLKGKQSMIIEYK